MTQTQNILEYLQEGQRISPLSALRMFGCLRLAARICDLRDQGVKIKTEYLGDGRRRYAIYSLKTTP